MTVIDAASRKVAGTVALGGKPEFPVSDRKGNIYANIEDKSEIVQIDSQALRVKKTWPLSPCGEPSGLVINQGARRLFAVCSNRRMAIVNADSGRVITTVAIGEGSDAAAYDPGSKLAFSSNGEGTLTVVRQDSPDKYTVLANVSTERSARTMALDTKTHEIYFVCGTARSCSRCNHGQSTPPSQDRSAEFPGFRGLAGLAAAGIEKRTPYVLRILGN